jgi:hypothetical protein
MADAISHLKSLIQQAFLDKKAFIELPSLSKEETDWLDLMKYTHLLYQGRYYIHLAYTQ